MLQITWSYKIITGSLPPQKLSEQHMAVNLAIIPTPFIIQMRHARWKGNRNVIFVSSLFSLIQWATKGDVKPKALKSFWYKDLTKKSCYNMQKQSILDALFWSYSAFSALVNEPF